MGRLILGVGTLLLSINLFAETLAQHTCEDLREQLIDDCEQTTFEHITFMDRQSIELHEGYQQVDQQDQYRFYGDRCIRNAEYNRIELLFFRQGLEGKNHCAVRTFYRRGDSTRMVLVRVFSGDNLIRLHRETEEEALTPPEEMSYQQDDIPVVPVSFSQGRREATTRP